MITPEAALRYADFVIDANRGRLICVREDHGSSDREAINLLVAIPLDGGEQHVLVEDNDFYATPALGPDGDRVAGALHEVPVDLGIGRQRIEARMEVGDAVRARRAGERLTRRFEDDALPPGLGHHRQPIATCA